MDIGDYYPYPEHVGMLAVHCNTSDKTAIKTTEINNTTKFYYYRRSRESSPLHYNK